MKSKQMKGYTFAIIAAVGFGMQPLLATFVYQYGVGSLLLALVRVALMVPIFAVAGWCRKERFRIARRDALKIAVLALTGAVLTTALLFTAYSNLDTGTATTLNFSYPVFVLALGAVLCRERLSKTVWLSFGLCVIGIVLFCNPSGAFTWKGFWMALGSGATYGVYVFYLDKSRVLERVGFCVFTFYFFLFAALMLLPLVCWRGELHLQLPVRAWMLLSLFAVDGGILATVLLQVGVREIGSGKAAIIGALEPVTSVVLGALFLHEAVKTRNIIAMALIITSTVLLIAADRDGADDAQKQACEAAKHG